MRDITAREAKSIIIKTSPAFLGCYLKDKPISYTFFYTYFLTIPYYMSHRIYWYPSHRMLTSLLFGHIAPSCFSAILFRLNIKKKGKKKYFVHFTTYHFREETKKTPCFLGMNSSEWWYPTGVIVIAIFQ